jgi:hypothetical protein
MCDRASLPVFHMSGELFKMMVGIDVPHVPQRRLRRPICSTVGCRSSSTHARVDWAPHLRQAAAIGGVSESVQTA